MFSKGGYFDGASFPIEFATPDYLKAEGKNGQVFIYRMGHFHFSFISYYHVTSMSGECMPRIRRLIDAGTYPNNGSSCPDSFIHPTFKEMLFILRRQTSLSRLLQWNDGQLKSLTLGMVINAFSTITNAQNSFSLCLLFSLIERF